MLWITGSYDTCWVPRTWSGIQQVLNKCLMAITIKKALPKGQIVWTWNDSELPTFGSVQGQQTTLSKMQLAEILVLFIPQYELF